MAIEAGLELELVVDGASAEDMRAVNAGLYELQLELAERIYLISQELVPVDSGFLKSTGSVIINDGTPMVVYTADYAEIVESGIPGTSREGQYFLADAVDEVMESLPDLLPQYLPDGISLDSVDIV